MPICLGGGVDISPDEFLLARDLKKSGTVHLLDSLIEIERE